MFKILRSKAKVFYWVIAASFVLFLGLGGMTGRGCQAPGSGSYESGVVGSVNGKPISAQDYDFTCASRRPCCASRHPAATSTPTSTPPPASGPGSR